MKIKLLLPLFLLLGVSLTAQLPQATAMIPISVSVTGFVPHPGTYQLTVFSRLSDAVKASRGELPQISDPLTMSPLQQKAVEEDSLYANFQGLRQLRLTRQGKSQVYDLLRFLRLGELEQNPLLKDGDLIWVPTLEQSVSVMGSVYLPGEYQFVPGDKLGDLLRLCQGFTPEANLKRILIYRYQPNGVDFDILSQDISAVASLSDMGFALMPRDRIIVGQDSEARRGWKVKVEGAVKTPGEFLIGDKSTLWDILQLCGGVNSRGDLGNAVLINGPYSAKLFPDLERLKAFSMGQMSPVEYSYLRSSLRQLRGKYSISLQECWDSSGQSSNPVLQDGDYIFVPEQFDMIAVSGQVRNPGLVPWVEGKDWKYYVEACGGYTNNRKVGGVRIIRDHSGNWVKPSKKLALRPGDMVFVAESTDRDLWADIKDVALLASQIVTIFLSIRAITSN